MTNTTPTSRTKTTQIQKKIGGFWSYCDISDYIPDIELLCKYLSINRSTLWRWEHSDKNDQLSNIIKNIKNDIFAHQKQLAMRGRINSAVFIFNAKNNFGYVDKVEHEHNSNTNITVTFNIPDVQRNLPAKREQAQVIDVTPTGVTEQGEGTQGEGT